MVVEKYSISLASDVASQVVRREGPRSTVINESLRRYFWLMEQERRTLRQLLTDGEIALITDVLNGVMFADPHAVRFVHLDVRDGIALDGLDQKWQVDGPALLDKLQAMSYGTLLALVDAVQLWWHRTSSGEKPPLTVAEVLK